MTTEAKPRSLQAVAAEPGFMLAAEGEPAMPAVYYASRSLSAAEQRRLHKLERRTEKVIRADRAFFDRFPHRRHRVRRAAPVEVEALAIARGCAVYPVPPGAAVFTVVRRVRADHRIRLFTTNAVDAETDLDEDAAAAIFAVVAGKAETVSLH